MLAPLEVSIFLNNALSATHVTAEIDSDTPLPESSRDMPSQVSGRFAGIDVATSDEPCRLGKDRGRADVASGNQHR